MVDIVAPLHLIVAALGLAAIVAIPLLRVAMGAGATNKHVENIDREIGHMAKSFDDFAVETRKSRHDMREILVKHETRIAVLETKVR